MLILVTKRRASFILIYDYLYIMSHVNLRLKFCPDSLKFIAPPLILQYQVRTLEATKIYEAI
jgi:hypothetical protein